MAPSRFNRYRALISSIQPFQLESWVRALLIHYFFHISDRQRIELQADPANPTAAPTINLISPTLFKGQGRIQLAASAVFGVARSPGSHSCSYVEARTPESLVRVGGGTTINNRATLISEGAGVHIGERCLIGTDFQAIDSNFHELALGRRHVPDQAPRPVVVEDDVFIGSNVTLLKGCRIGRGSVISAGTVVPPSFEAPPMSVIAGNPARVIGQAG